MRPFGEVLKSIGQGFGELNVQRKKPVMPERTGSVEMICSIMPHGPVRSERESENSARESNDHMAPTTAYKLTEIRHMLREREREIKKVVR